MDLKRVCKDIKSLKIQGASNISTAAIKTLEDSINKSKSKDKESLLKEINQINKELISARPTEPELENYLNYIYYFTNHLKYDDIHTLKKYTLTEIKHLLERKKEVKNLIAKNGSKLIKSDKVIFTHCHSSNVINILKEAHKRKKFTVYNTETRPLYQGRITAKELAQAKIHVKHFVDSAARIALRDSDIMLIGTDSITYNKVYNKVGSEMIALTAHDYNVPVYVCASLWKFNPHTETIEERKPSEVWDKPPKGVKVMNYAFEKISFHLIKGIICEEGILKPKNFVKKARKLLK